MTRRELGELVGTAPETVIRLLGEFQRKKLIAVDHRAIRVLDVAGLAHVADLYDGSAGDFLLLFLHGPHFQ